MTFDDSLRKFGKNKQHGDADAPSARSRGRSASNFSDSSISYPDTDTTSINRSDSRSDRRMLSHGDIMDSRGANY